MSVIGRLDDQVDSVLIAPLDRNKRRTAEAHEEEQQSENRQATLLSETGTQAQGEAEGFQSEQAEREELPVWLL